MSESVVKLHPRNYKKISGRIIFFLNAQKVSKDNFNNILKELSGCKTFVITSYKKIIHQREDTHYMLASMF